MADITPSHVNGRRLETLNDPKGTINLKNVDIGGYIRISTSKDAQLSSIDYQKKLLAEWAEYNGYSLVRFYIDIKSGAYTYLRNELQEMFEDLKQGKIKGLISKEIARTSRDVIDTLNLKRQIECYGGSLVSIKENYDSRTDPDEFLLTIHAGLAQKERKTTASRVKLTQIIKAKEGKTNVAHPAYGYMLSEDKQHLVVNPETAPILRFIIEKYLEGWGQLKIAKYLNSKGIPSSHGKKWGTNAIKTIITNPVYLGVTIYNVTTAVRDTGGKRKLMIRPRDEWIIREGTHEPLVTEEEYERIQKIVRERKEKDVKEWSCSRKYLGSGILYCSECGGRIYGSRMTKKVKGKKVPGNYYYRYVCQNRNGQCSSMKLWHMDKVDHIVLELFKSIFSDRKKLIETIKSQVATISDMDEINATEREEIKEKLAQVEKALKKQQIAYEEDVLDLEEYRQRVAELRQEKHHYIQKLQKLNDDLSKTDRIMQKVETIYRTIADKLDYIHNLPIEEKVQYIESTFEKIYLTKDYQITDIVFRL